MDQLINGITPEEQQQAEEDAYLAECGPCPNCNTPAHQSELGDCGGIICCFHCHGMVEEAMREAQGPTMVTVTRDMASDAGMPEIEGAQIPW